MVFNIFRPLRLLFPKVVTIPEGSVLVADAGRTFQTNVNLGPGGLHSRIFVYGPSDLNCEEMRWLVQKEAARIAIVRRWESVEIINCSELGIDISRSVGIPLTVMSFEIRQRYTRAERRRNRRPSNKYRSS